MACFLTLICKSVRNEPTFLYTFTKTNTNTTGNAQKGVLLRSTEEHSTRKEIFSDLNTQPKPY